MGFIIAKPLELLNWQALPVDEGIPWALQTDCPACASPLETLARLESKTGQRRVRIGACPSCGYVGYQDRPAREWISRYYAERWTRGPEKDIERLRTKKQKDNPPSRTVSRALAMLADRSRPIVEIGSGYGTLLKFIRERGFKNLIGLESSRRRAEAASRATAIPILAGDFESDAVQAELSRRAPIGLIYAFHVLEHTYDPADIIAAASRLQSPGDLLVIGVPNVWAEPAMSILLFLPHLHGFSPEALGTLLARNGYRVVDSSNSGAVELNIIAERTDQPITPPEPLPDVLGHARQKFRHELTLDTPLATGRRYRYFWSKKDAGVSGILPYRWYWRLEDRLTGRRGIRSLQIEPLDTAVAENATPLRIRFASKLLLCIK